MSKSTTITLLADVVLEGITLQAGSVICLSADSSSLMNACRLAGVDEQTAMRIKAYMPVGEPSNATDDPLHQLHWNEIVELAHMTAAINPFGDRDNAKARDKAINILAYLGMPLPVMPADTPPKVDVPQEIRNKAMRSLQRLLLASDNPETQSDAYHMARYLLSIDTKRSPV